MIKRVRFGIDVLERRRGAAAKEIGDLPIRVPQVQRALALRAEEVELEEDAHAATTQQVGPAQLEVEPRLPCLDSRVVFRASDIYRDRRHDELARIADRFE